MLDNFIGFIFDLDPGPILLVQPREADAEAFSKDRLAPMIRDCPGLRGKIAEARSRDSNNTVLHKKFTGGSIPAVGVQLTCRPRHAQCSLLSPR